MYHFPTLHKHALRFWEHRENEEKLLASECSLSCVQNSEIHGLGRLRLWTLALQTRLSALATDTTDPSQACKRLPVQRLTLIHHQRWATPLLQYHCQLASQSAPTKAIFCVDQRWSYCGVLTPVKNPYGPLLCNNLISQI